MTSLQNDKFSISGLRVLRLPPLVPEGLEASSPLRQNAFVPLRLSRANEWLPLPAVSPPFFGSDITHNEYSPTRRIQKTTLQVSSAGRLYKNFNPPIYGLQIKFEYSILLFLSFL